MTISMTRRSLTFLGAVSVPLALVGPAMAAVLPSPSGKKILSITGKIANTNDGGEAAFDRPMLEALGITSIETSSPWYDGITTFEGIRMDALMRFAGASGDTVTAVALNDFSTDIPISDFSRYGVLLALKRDGNYMPIRDKGPLFIVYPYDSSTELHAQKFYSRSAWQLARLIVR